MNAAEQNATLLILTTGTIKRAAEDYEYLKQIKAYEFARKIGLGRKNRRRRLITALAGVTAWFEEGGGLLHATLGPTGVVPQGKILFGRAMPVPSWARNGARKNRPKRSPKTDPNIASGPPKTDPNIGPLKNTKRKDFKEEAASAAPERFAPSDWEDKKELRRKIKQASRKEQLWENREVRQESLFGLRYGEPADDGPVYHAPEPDLPDGWRPNPNGGFVEIDADHSQPMNPADAR
jgi:hypothetical protein